MLTLRIEKISNWMNNGPHCCYCDKHIDDAEFIQLEMDQLEAMPHLHHNCVIAFAIKIQNEFDKL